MLRVAFPDSGRRVNVTVFTYIYTQLYTAGPGVRDCGRGLPREARTAGEGRRAAAGCRPRGGARGVHGRRVSAPSGVFFYSTVVARVPVARPGAHHRGVFELVYRDRTVFRVPV